MDETHVVSFLKIKFGFNLDKLTLKSCNGQHCSHVIYYSCTNILDAK